MNSVTPYTSIKVEICNKSIHDEPISATYDTINECIAWLQGFKDFPNTTYNCYLTAIDGIEIAHKGYISAPELIECLEYLRCMPMPNRAANVQQIPQNSYREMDTPRPGRTIYQQPRPMRTLPAAKPATTPRKNKHGIIDAHDLSPKEYDDSMKMRRQFANPYLFVKAKTNGSIRSARLVRIDSIDHYMKKIRDTQNLIGERWSRISATEYDEMPITYEHDCIIEPSNILVRDIYAMITIPPRDQITTLTYRRKLSGKPGNEWIATGESIYVKPGYIDDYIAGVFGKDTPNDINEQGDAPIGAGSD